MAIITTYLNMIPQQNIFVSVAHYRTFVFPRKSKKGAKKKDNAFFRIKRLLTVKNKHKNTVFG